VDDEVEELGDETVVEERGESGSKNSNGSLIGDDELEVVVEVGDTDAVSWVSRRGSSGKD
jgi:hypothetical protein